MSRLQSRFAELKQQNRAALVTFVTAGDPDYASSLEILKGLPAAGADVIEHQRHEAGAGFRDATETITPLAMMIAMAIRVVEGRASPHRATPNRLEKITVL